MKNKNAAAGFGATLAVALILWMSCGKDEKKPKTSSNPPPAPLALSSAYAKNCKGCHGASGEGPNALQGTKLTLTQFTATTRSGLPAKGMPAYAAAAISDKDLAADYAALTKK